MRYEIRFSVLKDMLKQYIFPTKIILHNVLHVYVTFEDTIIADRNKNKDDFDFSKEDLDFKVKRKLRREITLIKKLRFFKKICFEKKGFLTYEELSRYDILEMYIESLKNPGTFYTYQGCFLKFTLQGRSFGEGELYENEDECRAA